MPETANSLKSDEQSKEPQTSLKKSLLAQVVAQELGTTPNTLENKKPIPSFSWDFGKKKTADTNGKETSTNKVESSGGFIFGSRLADKVTNADSAIDDNKPKDASSIFKQFATNTPSGSLFSTTSSTQNSFLKPFGDASKLKTSFASTTSGPEHAIETFTGEENEKNLIHISCKFYIFDRESKSWLERGLGTLRINQKLDSAQEYRIIGRATGNQRVCINSKIFAEMLLDKMTDKRIKISAYSPEFDVPQLFVINGTPTDIANVHVKLEKLISKLKQSSNRKRPLGEDCRKDDLSVPPKNVPNKKDDLEEENDESDHTN